MNTVKEIMTPHPACCHPETDLQTVAQKMCVFNCGEIPVANQDDKVVGVVTDRDITCRTVALGKNPLELQAQDCMTPSCVTVRLDTQLDACWSLMEEHQIRRIPVVDEQGRCCGIVSQADIALKAPKEKAAEVLQEISRQT